MLAMARVLVEAPKVLVADELSLGLAPIIVDADLRVARDACGRTARPCSSIEQHVAHALALCDRVVVLDHGSVSWTGRTADAADRVRATLQAAAPG